mmetsp:Transcript_86403/g.135199  ORF Transcript_86403/g.135199 Transcript_86403/m.135199 type:complete len:442 (-) Transcript_86403:122-1447(-)
MTAPDEEDLEDVQVVNGPILLHIWEQFLFKDGRRYSDKVSPEDIILRWSHAASLQVHNSRWRIGVDTIEECVSHLAAHLCETPTSSIGMERWLHALLCSCAGLRARKAGMRLQALLRLNLARSHGLQMELEAATGGRDAHRKIADLLKICCKHMLQNPLVTEAFLPYALDGKLFTRLCLQAFGFVGDEPATYPQVLGICFGRVQAPVVLHFYDLSKGMAQSVANVEGIWHTGVVVFQSEYFYNGRVVSDTPNASDFGKANKAKDFGWTLYKQEEFHDYVCDNLTPAFTLNSYDTFSNNCNHFTNKVLEFLLGRPLQKEILHQQDQLLEVPGMRMLLPAFRIMIRGLYGDGGTRGTTVAASSSQSTEASGGSLQLSAEDMALLRFTDIDGLARIEEHSPSSQSKSKWSGQRVRVPLSITDAGGDVSSVDDDEIWSEASMASI